MYIESDTSTNRDKMVKVMLSTSTLRIAIVGYDSEGKGNDNTVRKNLRVKATRWNMF